MYLLSGSCRSVPACIFGAVVTGVLAQGAQKLLIFQGVMANTIKYIFSLCVCIMIMASGPVQARLDVDGIEHALLHRVNTLRAFYLSVEATYTASGEFVDKEGNVIPLSQMPFSLSLSEELSAAARSHARDMIDRVYYDVDTPSGITPAERAVEFGYQPVFVEESLGAVAFFGMIAPESAADMIFDEISFHVAGLFSSNCTRIEAEPILNPYVTQLGVGLQGGVIVIDGEYFNVYVLVLDFGCPVPEDNDSRIVWGHIFNDVNGNGLYDRNEGMAGLMVKLAGDLIPAFSPAPAPRFGVSTDGAGFYLMKVPPGDYMLSVTAGEQILEQYPVDLLNNRVIQNDMAFAPQVERPGVEW